MSRLSLLPAALCLFAIAAVAIPARAGTARYDGAFLLQDIDDRDETHSSNAPLQSRSGDTRAFFLAATSGIYTTCCYDLWTTDGTTEGTVLLLNNARLGQNDFFGATTVGDTLYFSSSGALWRSDGTNAGTIGLEFFTESILSDIGRLDERIVFLSHGADNAIGLWISDGSAAGTRLLHRFGATPDGRLPAASQGGFTQLGGTVFFAAYDGALGTELWETDGTPDGTVLVADLAPDDASSDPQNLTASAHTLFFSAADGTHGRAVWSLHGDALQFYEIHPDVQFLEATPQGAFLIVKNGDFDYILYALEDDGEVLEELRRFRSSVTAQIVGARLFVAPRPPAEQSLWVSDGTADGTVEVAAFPSIAKLSRWNDRLAIVTDSLLGNRQLWRSDGTPAGTKLIGPIGLGSLRSSGSDWVVLADRLLFSGFDEEHGDELWISDGTNRGTRLLRNIAPDNASGNPEFFTPAGHRLFFSASVGGATALWAGGGAPGDARLVGPRPIPPDAPYLARFTAKVGLPLDARLFFLASGGLWSSDGTPVGTVPIWEETTLYPAATEGALYALSGKELIGLVDAVAEPAPLFTLPALPLGRFFTGIVPFSAGLFLGEANVSAIDGGLWWTDDPADPPHKLASFSFERPRGSRIPREPVALGARIFFVGSDSAHGEELWQSDGTEAGTRLVADIDPTVDGEHGIGSAPRDLTVLGTQVFFLADDGEHGVELWRSGGTAASTAIVRDIRPGPQGVGRDAPTHGSRYSGQMVATDEELFFLTDDGKLWTSDGTSSGTHAVCDACPPAVGLPPALRVIDGVVVYTACGEGGCEPWASNGRPEGTVQLADIGGVASSNPRYYTAFGDLVVFAAEDEHGRELWALRRAALPQPVARACAHACDGSGPPRIADLIHAVAIALGRDVAPCPGLDLDGNDAISIAELVKGVKDALEPGIACAG